MRLIVVLFTFTRSLSLALDLGSDAAKVTATLTGQASASVGIPLCQLQIFECLKSFPGNSFIVPLGRAVVVVVHVAGHGCCAPVEPSRSSPLPVFVLDEVRDLHLAGLFEEGGKCHGELLPVDIPHRNRWPLLFSPSTRCWC